MTPQELKKSIISLAIQGKLVEQRPEEGTGEALYQQLKTEKQKRMKASKSESLVPVSEDDHLFEIPESWVWIKIGDIAAVVTKGTTPRGGNVSYLDKGIGFLRAENVAGYDKLDKSTLKYIDEKTHFGFLKRSILQCNDILITIAGTLGRTAIVREEDLPLNANQAVSIIRLVNPESINLLYLVYALNSQEIQKHLTGQKKITAIPNLTLEIIENCVIPLPPLAEQMRIVVKIEELLPYIDHYEQAWTKLEELNMRFPTDLQKSILQMAIQGKLVEQRPEEGTGEELYQQIQVEKQRLIKEGKLKKEKPLPKIAEDEIPFDIPESWKWVRFEESVLQTTDYVANGSFSSLRENVKTYKEPNYALMVKTQDFANGFKSDLTYTDKHGYEFLAKSALFGGELILSNIGASIGKAFIIPKLNIPMTLAPNSIMVKCINDVMTSYMRYMILSFYGQSFLKAFTAGTAMPKFSKTQLRNVVIPLPPLAEQKRIVAKLEAILPMCEKLKK